MKAIKMMTALFFVTIIWYNGDKRLQTLGPIENLKFTIPTAFKGSCFKVLEPWTDEDPNNYAYTFCWDGNYGMEIIEISKPMADEVFKDVPDDKPVIKKKSAKEFLESK